MGRARTSRRPSTSCCAVGRDSRRMRSRAIYQLIITMPSVMVDDRHRSQELMLVGSEDAARRRQPCSRSWRAAASVAWSHGPTCPMSLKLIACRGIGRCATPRALSTQFPLRAIVLIWHHRPWEGLLQGFRRASEQYPPSALASPWFLPGFKRRKRPCPRARSTTDASESPSRIAGKPSGIAPAMQINCLLLCQAQHGMLLDHADLDQCDFSAGDYRH